MSFTRPSPRAALESEAATAREMLEASPAALLRVDTQGVVEWANAAARAFGDGIAPGALLAQALALDADAAGRLAHVLAGGGCATLHAGGRSVEASASRLGDGAFVVALAMPADAPARAPDPPPAPAADPGRGDGANDAASHSLVLGRSFELAMSAAGIGFWSLDLEAERPRWSAHLRRIYGLGDEEPVPTAGEWLRRFVHPEDRALAMRELTDWNAETRRGLPLDLRILRADGELRHVLTHWSAEGRGARRSLLGLVIDITERRRAELTLRQASERTALAARSAGIGTWELDLESGWAHWDEQMWRLRGLEPQPQLPSAEGRIQMVHPDDRDQVTRHLEETLASDELPSHYEFRVVLPDGEVRWLASRSMVERDAQGRSLRRIGVNWDVTDRRDAEASRQERELAMRESEAKSKFLSRMSHELRTPLNGVLGFAQLLLVEDTGADAESASRRRRVEQIRAAGAHLLSLINDVLDLSSLEGGEMRIALEPVALAPLVAGALPLVEQPLQQRGIELVCGRLDGVTLADPTRLRQALLNLLTNAIKYNRRGGRVTVESENQGGRVVLRVSDTGRGMNEEQLHHLFEPFNRLGLEAEAIEGTGIGLAIVKALAERMGATVAVRSRVGVGSVFELRLLDAAAHAAPPPAPAPAGREPQRAGAPRSRGCLLYVEDNPVNAMIIAELVARRSDLQLHIAPDGTRGVRLAHELLPDLVLLDMQLPDFDGLEVLRRLRADPATASIPVIALSANAMPEAIERALRAGISDYWTKPLDFAAFSASIEALFGPPPT